jgi:hypothetical protein
MPPVTEPTAMNSMERSIRRSAAELPATIRRPYAAPKLRTLGSADDILDVLGPAQANYGGP